MNVNYSDNVSCDRIELAGILLDACQKFDKAVNKNNIGCFVKIFGIFLSCILCHEQ